MYCNKCGAQNPDGAVFCTKCGSNLNQVTPVSTNPPPVTPVTVNVQGAAATQPVQATQTRTSGLAIASLVLGILGISLIALILGAIGLNQMGKDPNLKGKGMAIAGLVLGIIGLISEIIIVIIVVIGALSTL